MLVSAISILVASAAMPIATASFNPHAEHAGAVGSLCVTGGVYVMQYDFSGGGHGVGIDFDLREPIWAEKIRFTARVGARQHLALVVRDSTGQCFYKHADGETPGEWADYEADVFSDWIAHWGGRGDGRVRLPLKAVSVNVDRQAKGERCPGESGTCEVRDLAYVEIPVAERVEAEDPVPTTNRVTCLLSDFRSRTHLFGAGPRVFSQRNGDYRDGSRPVADGRVVCDFAREPIVVAASEIPVWGTPLEYRLAVEAPAEAAGVGLSLEVIARRPLQGFLGTLDAPPDANGVIRQTFSVTADLSDESRWNAPWCDHKDAIGTGKVRVCGVRIARGACAAGRPVDVRLLCLEADVAAGHDTPPVLAQPPRGEAPPQELSVSFLNLDGVTRRDAGVEVTLRDWNGTQLGVAQATFPETAPGAVATVRVPLPAVAQDISYVQYTCRLCRRTTRDGRARASETSWTRPWKGTGSRALRTDLPWGFGAYVHRTEDRYAYPSGYETPTNAAALVEAEIRAALARRAGFKWERLELKPAQVTVEKGVYDFSVYDRLLDIAERNGLTCYVCCSHYWPVGYRGYTEEAMDEWAKVIGLAVRRWKGRCKYWEIWNEANNHFWSGTVEQYVYLCNRAYEEIKAADPEATVMTVSTEGVDTAYMDRCIAAGMKYDTISVHPYRREPVEEKFLADLAAVTNRTRGVKTVLSEFGWPTGLDRHATTTEREQAGFYARAYLTVAGSGTAKAICGYDLIDDGFNVLERESNFGIVRRNLTIKPAYRALATLCSFFADGTARLVSQPLTSDCTAWIFRMGGRSAVWTTQRMPIRVKTAVATTACDSMGQALGVRTTEHAVVTGPLSLVLIDGDVASVTRDDATARRLPALCF